MVLSVSLVGFVSRWGCTTRHGVSCCVVRTCLVHGTGSRAPPNRRPQCLVPHSGARCGACGSGMCACCRLAWCAGCLLNKCIIPLVALSLLLVSSTWSAAWASLIAAAHTWWDLGCIG